MSLPFSTSVYILSMLLVLPECSRNNEIREVFHDRVEVENDIWSSLQSLHSQNLCKEFSQSRGTMPFRNTFFHILRFPPTGSAYCDWVIRVIK